MRVACSPAMVVMRDANVQDLDHRSIPKVVDDS